MTLKYEMFPPELVELNIEVSHHPDLGKILRAQTDRDVYILLAEVAAFCGIALEGDYSLDDILKLCTLLTKKLYERRTGITLISSGTS
jgi:hypothetical protein